MPSTTLEQSFSQCTNQLAAGKTCSNTTCSNIKECNTFFDLKHDIEANEKVSNFMLLSFQQTYSTLLIRNILMIIVILLMSYCIYTILSGNGEVKEILKNVTTNLKSNENPSK